MEYNFAVISVVKFVWKNHFTKSQEGLEAC
jgi:hypothetical protein